MLLNFLDRGFIQEQGLFQNRPVYYFSYSQEWDALPTAGIDATRQLYGGQSVSIMAIQAAIYMGFKDIFLLGVDHDWILRLAEKLPTHFYKSEESILERNGLTDWMTTNWKNEFWSNWKLWDQYEKLKVFADSKGVRIYNATAGGLLDVFERVRLESLFSSPGANEIR